MKFSKHIYIPFYFIIIIYGVFVLDVILPFDLNHWGIQPRSISGLWGIVFSPFLHANIMHLVSNTIPAFVMLLLLYLFYPKKANTVVIFSVLLGGSLVWLFGRSATHIGASGLIYSLAAALVAGGFYRKKLVEMLLSIGVLIVYSGLIWGVLPTRSYISWEGHLFGAIAGVIAASLILKSKSD